MADEPSKRHASESQAVASQSTDPSTTAHLSALQPFLPATAAYLDTASLMAFHSSCKEWQQATLPTLVETVKRAIIRSVRVLPQMDAYAWFPACARLHVYRSPGKSPACAWLLQFELVGGMDEDDALIQKASYLGQRWTIAYGSPSALPTEPLEGDGWIMQAVGQPTICDLGSKFGTLTTTDKGPLVKGSQSAIQTQEVKEHKEEKDEKQFEVVSDAAAVVDDSPVVKGPVFAGLTFCVSGAFGISQGEMKQLIESEGGKLASTVNASVDYLVCNQAGSGKYTDAERKGKPVVKEEWVNVCIKQRRLSKLHHIFDPNGGPVQAAAPSKPSKPSAAAGSAASSSGGAGGKVFAGLTFCVSGAFEVSQAAMKKQLQQAGGTMASTVNASVDYLICNEEGSTKYQAAEEKGKPVVTEEWVRASIESGKLSKDPSHFTFNPNEDEDGGEGEDGEGEDGEGEEEEEPEGADWLYNLSGVHPTRKFVQLRNGSYPLHTDAEWYAERGVTVAQPGFVDGGINAVDVLRALVREHRDELLSTDDELKRAMNPACPLVKLLTLDDWYHSDGLANQCPDEVKTKEESSNGERWDHQGRYNPTVQALAQAIVDGSPAYYHEAVASGGLPPGNTHWDKWPESGFHK